MKKVLLIAGGKWQIPLAKKIKDLGYELICSNLYENSPVFNLADASYVANVLDVKRNLTIAQKHQVDAVVSDQSDIAMQTVAAVAETLNLPTNGMDIAKLFQDKILMREHAQRYGFFVPKFKACKKIDDALAFLGEHKKMVIKPKNSQASRGVFFIDDEKTLLNTFELSQSFAHDEKEVIAEEWMTGGTSDGREFTVDGIFIEGKHHTLAISKKRHYGYNKSIASELYFCLQDDVYDYGKLIRQNNALMESTNATMGLTHNEYKFHNGEFYLIEMSNRGGGNGISSPIVPTLSGVDNLGIYLKQALGENVPSLDEVKKESHPYAILKFFDHKQFSQEECFTIKHIEGLDEIEKHKHVLDVALNYNVGDTMTQAQNGTNRPGYYIAYADNQEELAKIDAWITKTLKVR